MKLISHDLQDGGKLPNRHVFNGMGYDGDNISPHLMWDDVPAGTKSFVVTCYDPDAPTGSGWWHWVVANLPADTRVLPQGAGSGQAELPEEHKAVLRELTGRSHRRQNMLLPKDLCYQKDTYMTTVYIYRPHLPRPLLLRGFFPMLVLPEKTTASMVLPAAYWSDEMLTEWLSDY